ncbi:hypothetical protein C8Q76DRAFT_792878 [Earliella scabrosa]|nr:hypothetical protein C8Q76DRAFT_792878 [Earliella scabrosa]
MPSDRMLWAARMEIIVVVWRICEALKAWSRREDQATVTRWNHGVGRELWRAIDAMGVAEAANYVGHNQEYVPPGPQRNTALLTLLRHARWVDRAIQFNVSTFAVGTFEAGCDLPGDLCNQFDEAFGSARWWLWGKEGPSDSAAPGWWSEPSPSVVGGSFNLLADASG